MLQRVFEVGVACWILLFLLRMMFKVDRSRPVMSKQHPSILPSFFFGHSRDVKTGQRDSAGIGRGNELIKSFCI